MSLESGTLQTCECHAHNQIELLILSIIDTDKATIVQTCTCMSTTVSMPGGLHVGKAVANADMGYWVGCCALELQIKIPKLGENKTVK